jgi:hypothetical protein
MPDLPVPLNQIRTIVFADPKLQQELRRAPDRASFVALLAERSREHGCAVDAATIEAALDAGARAWTMHWVEP